MRPVTYFVASPNGPWSVLSQRTIIGSELQRIECLSIADGVLMARPQDDDWPLRGIVSHGRYVTRAERTTLEHHQPPLGRPSATRAALIPIAKSAAWWDLAQDERRAIVEERSAHIATGLQYLPAIARRLYHCRDLGEPFDFVTWFEFAPEDEPQFDNLLARLRRTPEWTYVAREVEIRLTSGPAEPR